MGHTSAECHAGGVAARLQAGDHVKVGAGQHEGATGMVVRVEDPISILLDDATREELRVFTRDLSESGETATGLDRRARAHAPACACMRALHACVL